MGFGILVPIILCESLMADKKFIDLQIVQNTKVDKMYNKIAKKSQLKLQSQFRKFLIFVLRFGEGRSWSSADLESLVSVCIV